MRESQRHFLFRFKNDAFILLAFHYRRQLHVLITHVGGTSVIHLCWSSTSWYY